MAITTRLAFAMELTTENGEGWPVDAELSYTDADPYAVTLRMEDGYGAKTWCFARQLLDAGFLSDTPKGRGDISIWTCRSGEHVRVELRSPEGNATLHASHVAISEFLEMAYDVVAWGAESHYMDLDAMVRELTKEAK